MQNNRVFIIAEAGVNHNGKLEIALEMIHCAKECGVDAIKFQTYKTDEIVTKYAKKADYQNENEPNSQDQYSMLKQYELSEEQFVILKKECDKLGLCFLSTAFDMPSLNFLKSIGIEKFKVPSGEITNLPLLERIGSFHGDVILSTGMAQADEIAVAIDILKRNGCGNICVLQCTSAYPAPFENVNLSALKTIREMFNVNVGFSDHTVGIEAAIAAVALGAKILEKHFTLDRNMPGPDHKASILPEELSQLVRSVRNVEAAMGNGIKMPTEAEKATAAIVRKSIVAVKNIKKGEVFTPENINVKRPGNGISPLRWYEVIGQTAKRDFQEDELIEL